MKTAEEYSDDVMKLWSKFDWDEIDFNQFKNYVKNYIEQAQKEAYNQALQDATEKAKVAYTKGYMEAMRWRDPKEELPEDIGLYLCKCEKELGFYFDIVFFNKVWRSDSVIGWRPIE